MKERDIAASIMKWLNSLPDTVAWKITDGNNVGFPDIMGVHKGLAFFFEVKSEIGRVTPKQVYQMDKINECGGRTSVARSPGEAQIIFKDWFQLNPIFLEKIRRNKSVE